MTAYMSIRICLFALIRDRWWSGGEQHEQILRCVPIGIVSVVNLTGVNGK